MCITVSAQWRQKKSASSVNFTNYFHKNTKSLKNHRSFCRQLEHMVCARHGTCIFLLGIYSDYPEGANPLWASWRSPLVSCKGVSGDRKSEGSKTTRVCTDEQELHKRHDNVGKQPHLCKAPGQ